MPINFSRRDSALPLPDARAYLKRAALFAAGLALLFVALQLVPETPVSTDVVSDDAGSIARSAGGTSGGPSFGPGVAVAALILVGGSILALVLRRRSSTSTQDGLLVTLADMPIAPDQRIRLIRCRDEVLMVGITSGQISVLQVYPAEEFEGDEHPPTLSPAFAEMLRQAAGRGNLPRN